MAGNIPSAIGHCRRKCVYLTASRRAFSSSSRCSSRGPLINFPPTSSPELDALFAEARSEIFFPNHLRPMDRRVLYRESQHYLLTKEEPVFVSLPTVDALNPRATKEERFQLKPKAYFDKMSNRTIIQGILRLAQTKEDWALLIPFLQEFQAAKRKVKPADVSRLVRMAATRGQHGPMIEMFRRSGETGLHLRTKELAMELMLLCLHRASTSDWEEAALNKATKNADFAIRLMASPEHAPDGIKSSQANQPEVLGVALALASIKSIRLQNSQDADGIVKQYAQRFLKSWSAADLKTKQENLGETNVLLTHWAPAWLGVQLARRIVQDNEIQQALDKIYQDQLNPFVTQAREVLQAFSKPDAAQGLRGLEMWKTISAVLEK